MSRWIGEYRRKKARPSLGGKLKRQAREAIHRRSCAVRRAFLPRWIGEYRHKKARPSLGGKLKHQAREAIHWRRLARISARGVLIRWRLV